MLKGIFVSPKEVLRDVGGGYFVLGLISFINLPPFLNISKIFKSKTTRLASYNACMHEDLLH
jgi:hypothetical protein